MQVKQAVAGYGGADKRQVMLMTQRLLSMTWSIWSRRRDRGMPGGVVMTP